MSKVSYSEYEEHNQHDLDIEIEPQGDLDLDPAHVPNQWPNPKWAEKLIEAAWNVVGDSYYRRIMRSHYQNEHVALSNLVSISLVR